MKKIVALLAALILMMLATTALAATYKPGDTVTVPIYVNPANACYVKVKVSGNGWCSIVSLSSNYGDASSVSINGAKNPALPSGQFGSATVKINDGVAAGDYKLKITVSEAYDLDENDVAASAYSGTVTIEAPACKHSYGAWGVTTAATCTKDGVETRECSLCGEKETRTIEATGHDYETVIDKAPTCGDTGHKTLTCSKCGDVQGEEIAATGKHDYVTTTYEPTCGAPGSTVKTCSVCGDVQTTTIPATGNHNWDKGFPEVEVSCFTDGVWKYICMGCNAEKTETIKAPKKHTPDKSTEQVETAPTCTTNGKSSYTCSVCGEKVAGGVIEALGHDEIVNTTEPTCAKDGETVTTCSRCDYRKVKKLSATGKHTFETKVTTEPTCGAAGVETTTCTVCGKSSTKSIPATKQHTYEEKVEVEPTCTAKGKSVFTCAVCGDSYSKTTNAKGHTPGADLNEKKPTCSKPGYKYYTCTVCGADVKDSSIPATKVHIYELVEEVPATCTANGKRVSKCTYEGCTKTKTETLKKLGHKMGEWTVVTAPTCDKNGEEKRECLNGCGKVETRALKASHNWGDWIVDEENGVKTHECAACGKSESKKLANYYSMNVCSYGIRFRDIDKSITKDWYMFTPIDLSVEGEQTVGLIAGNKHQIGTATVLVKDGKVTVTTKVNNTHSIAYTEEFLTFVPSLADLTELDFDALTNYAYGEEISIEETLGGDTKVLMLMRNKAWYADGARGVDNFNGKGKTYNAEVEALKQLMD